MNLYDLPELPMADELTSLLVDESTIRIERIVSTGQVSGWYDQDATEFVVLLQGNAEIEFDNNRIVTVSRGDTLLIQSHERHRLKYTSTDPPCIWLCVFF